MFIVCLQVTQCNSAHVSLGETSHSYPRIMAARGLRHFGLVTQRLICLSLTSRWCCWPLGGRLAPHTAWRWSSQCCRWRLPHSASFGNLGRGLVGHALLCYDLPCHCFEVGINEGGGVLPMLWSSLSIFWGRDYDDGGGRAYAVISLVTIFCSRFTMVVGGHAYAVISPCHFLQ